MLFSLLLQLNFYTDTVLHILYYIREARASTFYRPTCKSVCILNYYILYVHVTVQSRNIWKLQKDECGFGKTCCLTCRKKYIETGVRCYLSISQRLVYCPQELSWSWTVSGDSVITASLGEIIWLTLQRCKRPSWSALRRSTKRDFSISVPLRGDKWNSSVRGRGELYTGH